MSALTVTLGADITALRRAMAGATELVGASARRMGKMTSAGLAGLGKGGAAALSKGFAVTGVALKTGIGAALAGGAAAMGGGVKAVNSAADFEQTKVAFTTLIGDAAKAEQTLNKLIKLGAETPFHFPYSDRFARPDSYLHPYYGSAAGRRGMARQPVVRSWSILSDRPWLHGLRTTHSDSKCGSLFCDASEVQPSVHAALLDAGGPVHWIASDHVGKPTLEKSRTSFPVLLRRVKYYDSETVKEFVFLTNNLEIPALTVAMLYKMRWRVELFFRWIKGHLRIKHYYGTSPNAVKTQIWIAITTYLIIAILHKQLQLPGTHHRTLQLLSVHPFEKVTLNELLMETDHRSFINYNPNQLNLFEL